QSTVSLVLSGKGRGRISARTEAAVRAAAAELGYRPNVAARMLRTGVARTVGLVVPDITNPFFGRMMRGAQRAAQQAGYTVVLVDAGGNRAWEAESLQALLAGPADGLLLFEVTLPAGVAERAIGIEMAPGELPDDDILAGGFYLAARERGVAIPGGVSVIGFDDLDFARVLAPPLTTVACDAEGLGAAAFRALASDLAGDPPPAEQTLPVRLEVREPTAPPRG